MQTPRFHVEIQNEKNHGKRGEDPLYPYDYRDPCMKDGWSVYRCIQGYGFFSPLLVGGKRVYVLNCAELAGNCHCTIKTCGILL